VTRKDDGSCASCSSNAFCAVKDQTFTALNTKGLSLREGDRVEIYLPSGKTILSGFMTLIVPLIFFLVFFLLSGPVLGLTNEGAKVLAGIIGVAFGFLVSLLYSRLTQKKNMPEVIGIANDDVES